ncbi:tRNA (N6-threonylcarbamoyladenosine(37)-N6)-methyltransferase TrmO [candidate division KSB1 bacterium]|nr:MAG: tRNA (N6-threonylcarbamoyladenosine(37)-N6)-methyltransferase TrmO [candidate division KSB1 bacterium]
MESGTNIERILTVDPAMGMAGDMFSAALIGLGVPASVVTGVMEHVARFLGSAKVQAEVVSTKEGPGVHLRTELEVDGPHLSASDARTYLEAAVREEHLSPAYADFARRALECLIAAEREAHSSGQLDVGELHLKPIGIAHTPYHYETPRQPQKDAKGEFYVELFPEFAAGLAGVEAFSHIYVISYLHRTSGYSLTVTPPWQEGEKARRVGLFASRSPNRPSPLGFTLTQMRRVEGNRIYTGPLDLFDGTPVVDIKPHLRTLDETDFGNDGWLADSDHLRLHKEGIPHHHASEEAVLHEAQDILLDIMGAAKGLEFLEVSLENVVCLTPVSVGGGQVRFSHGTLPVPTPAVAAILKRYRIPHATGPVDSELLTPTGAALLAALRPRWRPREMGPEGKVAQRGLGLGTKKLELLNGLRLMLR